MVNIYHRVNHYLFFSSGFFDINQIQGKFPPIKSKSHINDKHYLKFER